MRRFSPTELNAFLGESEQQPLLLDVREPWEFELGHLPGSRLVPLSQLPQALDTLDPERPTAVICHHGVRSLHAATFLEQQAGFRDVINLEGGVDAWAREVDPDFPRY